MENNAIAGVPGQESGGLPATVPGGRPRFMPVPLAGNAPEVCVSSCYPAHKHQLPAAQPAVFSRARGCLRGYTNPVAGDVLAPAFGLLRHPRGRQAWHRQPQLPGLRGAALPPALFGCYSPFLVGVRSPAVAAGYAQ